MFIKTIDSCEKDDFPAAVYKIEKVYQFFSDS